MWVSDPGTGVTSTCELPCGCWELNPGPLEEQPVLLTAEPSLQPLGTFYSYPLTAVKPVPLGDGFLTLKFLESIPGN